MLLHPVPFVPELLGLFRFRFDLAHRFISAGPFSYNQISIKWEWKLIVNLYFCDRKPSCRTRWTMKATLGAI